MLSLSSKWIENNNYLMKAAQLENGKVWCDECQRHRHACQCDTPVHIFMVEFRLITEFGDGGSWCQEKVRCVASDINAAKDKVKDWLLTTPIVWYQTDEGDTDKHPVPLGARNVTIVHAEKYLDDVGELLKHTPLPPVFAHEG